MSRSRLKVSRVTIHDVAKRAGVSAMTVSNAVNRSGRVSAATRERVLQAAADLGYVPNQAARHLVGSAVARVGLLYPAVDSVFIEGVLAAVAVVAAEAGVQLKVRALAGNAVAHCAAEAQNLVRDGAQALLLIPPFAEILAVAGSGIDVPVAAIATATALPGVTTIRVDNWAAARAITDLMVKLGRRRIAVVAGPQHHSDSVARLEGYRDALRDHGLPVEPDFQIEGDFTFSGGLVAAEKLLSVATRPDAIVAGNDDMAAAILWIAHQKGLRVPTDLFVAGFDDTLLATRVWPQLTTIRQPVRAMATAAMHYLAAAARGASGGEAAEDVVLPFELIERGSTADCLL